MTSEIQNAGGVFDMLPVPGSFAAANLPAGVATSYLSLFPSAPLNPEVYVRVQVQGGSGMYVREDGTDPVLAVGGGFFIPEGGSLDFRERDAAEYSFITGDEGVSLVRQKFRED